MTYPCERDASQPGYSSICLAKDHLRYLSRIDIAFLAYRYIHLTPRACLVIVCRL